MAVTTAVGEGNAEGMDGPPGGIRNPKSEERHCMHENHFQDFASLCQEDGKNGREVPEAPQTCSCAQLRVFCTLDFWNRVAMLITRKLTIGKTLKCGIR